jgi:hypothetical protein
LIGKALKLELYMNPIVLVNKILLNMSPSKRSFQRTDCLVTSNLLPAIQKAAKKASISSGAAGAFRRRPPTTNFLGGYLLISAKNYFHV